MIILFLSPFIIQQLVQRSLEEDMGMAGDITSAAIFAGATPPTVKAAIRARQHGVIAGIEFAMSAFTQLDSTININLACHDGKKVKSGDILLEIQGKATSILAAERVALNFLTHLSGIATTTQQMCVLLEGTKAKLCCTRKTIPGLRAAQKYAVRMGGGSNQRFGLFDAVLIKDNHIAAAGSITAALTAIRHHLGHMVKAEIEVDTMDQVKEAIAMGAEILLLDNMSPAQLIEAVQWIDNRAITEASGRVRPDNIQAIAASGVDYISAGWITHSAPALDIALDL
ncbi:MAG: carboxylating nicotinate-nucleotide diphosphorylase [Alphaproteobacteria bacterium]